MKKKTFHFWGKTFAVALTAAVAGVVMEACSDDEEKEEIIPTEVYNYNIYASENTGKRAEANGGVKNDIEIVRDMDFLKQLAKDPTTKEINIIAVGDHSAWEARHIKTRREFIEERRNISPKIKGYGEMITYPGVASQVPADSAALASWGYIIGHHPQHVRNNN